MISVEGEIRRGARETPRRPPGVEHMREVTRGGSAASAAPCPLAPRPFASGMGRKVYYPARK